MGYHPNRRLVLVDIENFLGAPVFDENTASGACCSITQTLNLNENDLVIIGTSHSANLFAAHYGWETARQVMQKGHDGADLALLEEMTDDLPKRFAEIVLVSGDGIFADRLAAMAQNGLAVTVLVGRGSLNRNLFSATQHIIKANLELAA